jgi:hypothetical protein
MMISKQDAARYLQSQGYDADVSSDGVVVVYLTMNEMTAATLRKIKKMLEGIGYSSSWGVKPGRDAK